MQQAVTRGSSSDKVGVKTDGAPQITLLERFSGWLLI